MGISFNNDIVRYDNLAIVSAGVNSCTKGRVVINDCIIKITLDRVPASGIAQ